MIITAHVVIAQDATTAKFRIDTIVAFNSTILKSHYSINGAKEDIANDKMRILFPGGFVGMPTFTNQKDKAFQRKYKVEFFSQGCVKYGEDEDEKGYNLTIFTYLDIKYGTKWRNEIRSDAIGLIKPIVN